MEHTVFAQSGTAVSRLGFGAMGFAGWFGQQDMAANIRSVHYALDHSVNFFDTARAYGDSETILGEALRSWAGAAPFVATKAQGLAGEPQWGRPVPLERSYPRGHITADCERSLRALKRETIDLYQLHTWWPSWGVDGYWREELDALRRSGKVRAIGVSIPDHRSDIAIELARSRAVDSIQTVINIFDPLALDSLVPICEANGVAVIARCILDEGGLSGFLKPDTRFAHGDFREGYFDTIVPRSVYIEKVDRLRRYVPQYASSLAALAIRYVLQNKGVTAAITSMHVEQYAQMNIAAAEEGPLPDWLFEELFTMHRFALHLSYFKNFGRLSD
ncbi:MAG: aldo/keto reductase [Devosia sp.]